MILGFLGETLNIMERSRLDFASRESCGDATVTIANIERGGGGVFRRRAAQRDASLKALRKSLFPPWCQRPASASISAGFCWRCRSLPLCSSRRSRSVAMLGRTFLSGTDRPTMAMYMLKESRATQPVHGILWWGFIRAFERGFERLRNA